jgi:transcriptional regulator with XRE-family HTH domain
MTLSTDTVKTVGICLPQPYSGQVALRDIAGTVRTARTRLGWTREALAFHSGVSWSAIAQIESGRRKDIHVSSLVALASALGVSVDYLIGSAGSAPQLFEHRALIHDSDDTFVAAALPYMSDGVAASQCVLAVASEGKLALLRDALGDQADDVEFAEWTDWYSSPTAALRGYGDYVTRKCERGGDWVRVVAEAGWGGETGEDLAAWQRYESLVNLVFVPWPATILCTYDARAFPDEVLAQARLTHPALAEGNDVVANHLYRDPSELLLDPDDG